MGLRQLLVDLVMIWAILCGVLAQAVGLLALERAVRIYRGDRVDINALEPGYAGVEGTARERSATVTAPLSGTECLAYHVIYETYRRRTDMMDWHVDHTESRREQFDIEDRTGTVTVDPSASDLNIDPSIEDKFEVDDQLPSTFQQYLDTYELAHSDTKKHRFTEKRLEPGDETFAFGVAVRDPDSETTFTIIGDDGNEATLDPVDLSWIRRVLAGKKEYSSTMVISGKPHFTTSINYFKRAAFYVFLGTYFVVMGGYYLLNDELPLHIFDGLF